MPTLELKIPSEKNEGLVMSPSELLETYFFGIPNKAQDGRNMPSETITMYLEAAQEEVENWLNIKIQKQVIKESSDFWREEFKHWGYIRTAYPVVDPIKLQGFINDVQQIDYPSEWLSSRVNSDGRLFFRHIHLIPTISEAQQSSVIFSGITPHLGFFGHQNIPNYWRSTYCTGFDKVPSDLVNYIGKLAAINIFHIQGDLILGAGIASQSIGIDGLSQSISTTSSATNAGYGARIIGYLKDLKDAGPKLKAFYDGFELNAM